jgi:hypothetical protein
MTCMGMLQGLMVARGEGALELLRGDASQVPSPRNADKGNVFLFAPWTSAAVDSDISSADLACWMLR